MEIKQQLKQRQKLTQQLRQSLRILALPLQDLRAIIENELAENPVIEEVASGDQPESITQSLTTPPTENDYFEQKDFPFSEKKSSLEEDQKKQTLIVDRKENLYDFLCRQINIIISDQQQLKIAINIINNIDENGYFKGSIQQIAQIIGCTEAEVEKTLELIKRLEPAGVGATNLKECLLLQIQRLKNPNPLAIKIIENHLDDLAKKDYQKITKKLKIKQQDFAQALQQILTLEPKPGRQFSFEQVPYISVDALIEEKENDFVITVLDESLPKIFINPKYKKMLNDKNIDEEIKNFVRQKINSAQNLIRAIKQRSNTIYRVIEEILKVQKDALLEGMNKLKPLTLKDIAKKIGLHQTTISRVVMNKYVQTPYGIFALKDFFSRGLVSQKGEAISSQKIKLLIKDLIDNEDKNNPLTDQALAKIITEQEKTIVARRTIAKYRKLLKIPPTSQRRNKIYPSLQDSK